ncbi:hypothetical protein BG74_06780 [Sodalis-like endosymbiont of Proechinophthirus fluctus]|nr:hypothetical protein BG74_06780 [Sodalis-like endosymbiont of Proechinophthirus fluctus]
MEEVEQPQELICLIGITHFTRFGQQNKKVRFILNEPFKFEYSLLILKSAWQKKKKLFTRCRKKKRENVRSLDSII